MSLCSLTFYVQFAMQIKFTFFVLSSPIVAPRVMLGLLSLRLKVFMYGISRGLVALRLNEFQHQVMAIRFSYSNFSGFFFGVFFIVVVVVKRVRHLSHYLSFWSWLR